VHSPFTSVTDSLGAQQAPTNDTTHGVRVTPGGVGVIQPSRPATTGPIQPPRPGTTPAQQKPRDTTSPFYAPVIKPER
jgi:hypothetical protein